MIHTWILDVSPLRSERIYHMCYDQLPETRREKADRLRYKDGKMQSVGVWILYQRMLEHYHLTDRMPYNFSHSGRYALCSVSDQMGVRVGCDVEMIRDNQPELAERYIRLAERYFCPSEAAWIKGQQNEKEHIREFCRYWVLKESFVKATGLGMKLDFREFEIALENGRAKLVHQPEAFSERYYYQEDHVKDGDARASVCSTGSGFGELRYLDERNII